MLEDTGRAKTRRRREPPQKKVHTVSLDTNIVGVCKHAPISREAAPKKNRETTHAQPRAVSVTFSAFGLMSTTSIVVSSFNPL